MAAEVSRNGKIGAGVVLFLVLAVVATLAVGSAFGWYEEKRNLDIPHQNGYKERVSNAWTVGGGEGCGGRRWVYEVWCVCLPVTFFSFLPTAFFSLF